MGELFSSGWFWLAVVAVFAFVARPSFLLGRWQGARRRRRQAFDRRLEQLQRKRRSRVIALVHRDDYVDPYRSIDIEDSEDVLSAIRDTPRHQPIELILHTPGGMGLASLQIARALKDHPAKKTIFVPHWAMSGGTLIALAADEIVMSDHAVLGPVDPQYFWFPAVSLIKLPQLKSADAISDEMHVLIDIARKGLDEARADICELIGGKLSYEGACSVANDLMSGKYSHGHPLTVDAARELGLKVSTHMPREIVEILELFPRRPRTPSVRYVR
jgi:ClpP class serine protease